MNYPYRIRVSSPLGSILVQGSQTHIQYLKFESANAILPPDSVFLPNWNDPCRQQLDLYFANEALANDRSENTHFEFDLPIAPQGTDFQQRVWQALCEVKYGTFASYQQLAIAIGNKKSVRAVATANARNPIWLVIPCHRIIGSDRALCGYAGGIERKAKLLQLEHHQLDADHLALLNEKTKILN